MALVKFVATTAAKYASAVKDDATLYFVTDTRTLYKGSVPYSGGIYETVTADPTDPEVGKLYINTATGAVKFYNGVNLVTVVKPYASTLEGTGDNSTGVTSKAVIDYVASKISELDAGKLNDRLTAVETKSANNETAIETLNGNESTTGSVAAKVAAGVATAATDATTKANAAQAAAEKTASDNLAAAKSELQTSIDTKATKASTLAGYGITDAYTKTDADSAIASAVANAHHLKREIVEALPAVADANEDTIYMVPKASGVAGNTTGNVYVEYMLINGAFEQIGDSTVDLSDYITTATAEGKIATAKSEAIDAAKTETTSQVSTAKSDLTTAITNAKADAISSAETYADGLAKNYATAAQGAKADSALQSGDIKSGSANGTIAVAGTNVSVKGLGSAAYTASTDYATAAQGAKADSALQPSEVTTGSVNGTISVDGTDVAVQGLGNAAYQATTAFDAAGTASTAASEALTTAKQYTDTSLTWGAL